MERLAADLRLVGPVGDCRLTNPVGDCRPTNAVGRRRRLDQLERGRQGLVADIGLEALGGLAQLGAGADLERDAVAVAEVAILAQALDAADDVAHQSLLLQIVVDLAR